MHFITLCISITHCQLCLRMQMVERKCESPNEGVACVVCVITEHMQMAYSSEPDVLMNVNEK